MQLQDFENGPRYQATVLQNRRITSDVAAEEVRELLLEVQQSSFDYQVGQSVGVVVPGIPEIGHPHHFRLYTVADTPQPGERGYPLVTLCVRRCSYIDEYSGEQYQGVASNYLCDRHEGDPLEINGPFGVPFPVPQDKGADLMLIGMGAGIAPFRAFLKHIYQDIGDWQGRVRLFFGAHSGLDLIYMNDLQDDFSLYYDQQTFEAIKALSPRGDWLASTPAKSLEQAIDTRAEEVLDILKNHRGYTYVAGLKDIEATLDNTFGRLLASAQSWRDLKATLKQEGRWIELIY